ncbi:MAG: hypothetical protein CME06_16095 [Gemmatimonadetes bacterium]|nr:hypothetical protein [Gemmatimonadota bacterium]
MPREAQCAQARAWMQKAANDLKAIEIVLPHKDGPLDTVAFHAQQAAEKSLKALAVFAGQQPQRTHDLEALWARLPDSDRQSLAVDEDDLELLSQMAVAPRYPGWDDEFDDRDTIEHAVAVARLVYQAVAKCLERQGCM